MSKLENAFRKEKSAETSIPLHEFVSRRWSPVAFSDKAVAPEDLVSILEAGRWAPSCYNDQPWFFLVGVKGDETYPSLLKCLIEKNQTWAQHAPVLMIVAVREAFEMNGAPNPYAWHDAGLAIGNMLFQATALGISGHPMAGFSANDARQLFGIPEGFSPVTAIAFGYQGEGGELPEEVRARDEASRSRKPLDSCVFAGAWGMPSPLVDEMF